MHVLNACECGGRAMKLKGRTGSTPEERMRLPLLWAPELPTQSGQPHGLYRLLQESFTSALPILPVAPVTRIGMALVQVSCCACRTANHAYCFRALTAGGARSEGLLPTLNNTASAGCTSSRQKGCGCAALKEKRKWNRLACGNVC